MPLCLPQPLRQFLSESPRFFPQRSTPRPPPPAFLGIPSTSPARLPPEITAVKAVVEPDNPKLAELLRAPLYDSAYYATQLSAGLALLDLRVAQALKSTAGAR